MKFVLYYFSSLVKWRSTNTLNTAIQMFSVFPNANSCFCFQEISAMAALFFLLFILILIFLIQITLQFGRKPLFKWNARLQLKLDFSSLVLSSCVGPQFQEFWSGSLLAIMAGISHYSPKFIKSATLARLDKYSTWWLLSTFI